MFLNNGNYPTHAAVPQEHIFLILNLISNYIFPGSVAFLDEFSNKIILYEFSTANLSDLF